MIALWRCKGQVLDMLVCGHLMHISFHIPSLHSAMEMQPVMAFQKFVVTSNSNGVIRFLNLVTPDYPSELARLDGTETYCDSAAGIERNAQKMAFFAFTVN